MFVWTKSFRNTEDLSDEDTVNVIVNFDSEFHKA